MKDRKDERVLTKRDLIINDSIKASTLDISEGGMYIYTQAEFIQGAVLELNFDVADGPIRVKARVQHTQPGVGIGVKFIGLPHKDSMRIKRLLERLQHVSQAGVPGKKRVLLVDDDARSRSVHKTRLFQDGFTVIEASTGLEAFRLLQYSRPDIVILDLWMEDIDGFKILQLMQMNPELKMVPVLILSARSVPSDVEKALSLGARDFLLKMTTTPIKLSEKVKEVLGGA